MQPWKLILAYDGSNFHGWQIQPNLPTIQGTLAQTLRRITGESVLPQGSGRTDTGVHALGQVASFALAAPIPPANLLRALNRALPPSIRILSAEHAAPTFHARHSALSKTYEYRIFPRVNSVPHSSQSHHDEWEPPKFSQAHLTPDHICSPFQSPYLWDCPWPIDLNLAQQAANHVLGTHDFTSFAASDPDRTTRAELSLPDTPKANTRTIYASTFSREENLILYRVTGSGFLHHMVRNLVGTFIEAASGRTPPAAIPAALAACNRAAAGQTAPARGLFLLNVEY